jgi:hypothetical protein
MRKIAIWAAFIIFGLLFIGCDVSPDATFRVLYYGNEHTSGYPHEDPNQYKYGEEALILDKNSLLKQGYIFENWNTHTDGSGDSYAPGDKKIIEGPVFLYAIWAPI